MRKRCARICTLVLVGSALFAASGTAQFKRASSDEPKVSDSFIRPASSSDWLDFFNPENFKMRQSYSMSYSTMGGQGLALGVYTNSMLYKISSKVDARVDISLQHSPYSTFDKSIQNSLSGVFLNRAEINYRPAENMLLQISYRQVPLSLYGFYSPYSGFYRGLENYEGY